MGFLDRVFLRETENPPVEPDAKVARRVKTVATPELVTWIDTTSSTVGHLVSQGNRAERPEEQDAYLAEAHQSAEVLTVMISELRERLRSV